MSNNKSENLKEKFKQALQSTAKAISGDFQIQRNSQENKGTKKLDFLDIDNLNTKKDFVKARAYSDSFALKKKFSNEQIYIKNLPTN